MAVNPPVCRLCGAAHWSGASHQFPDSPKVDRLARVKAKVAAVVSQPAKPPAKASRAEYMREYMAKRRAKAQAKT